ncbi:hypothetical protein GQ600_26280 [Phytophthora cactorum]|nr:hypothetical protein GQ600_26280 [Phytophthora cactorum]
MIKRRSWLQDARSLAPIQLRMQKCAITGSWIRNTCNSRTRCGRAVWTNCVTVSLNAWDTRIPVQCVLQKLLVYGEGHISKHQERRTRTVRWPHC